MSAELIPTAVMTPRRSARRRHPSLLQRAARLDHLRRISRLSALWIFLCLIMPSADAAPAQRDDKVVRVFLFAGQSNMVGADSRASEAKLYPPFAGINEPQRDVLFSYCIGREDKAESKGWVELQPVHDMVGPELSFARRVAREVDAPIAIIKVAAGGTTLGGDWNPDEPSGFRLYPLALEWTRKALEELERRGLRYRLEGFCWHQGENDMFQKDYRAGYAKNLARFMECWRRDLKAPELRFYVGELCTKTVWGMDHRAEMNAIGLAQRDVTDKDPLADFVPTAHIAIEIGGDGGLHYHYGTLGQLEHGENYADAYLRTLGKEPKHERPLESWPWTKGSKVRLFVLAGHRNMEGERAFVQDLGRASKLRDANPRVPYRFSVGGGFRDSADWEPLGPAGCYDTFGPELSFGATLARGSKEPFAIAKFTHSGSQLVDWTPDGSETPSRNLYAQFLEFVRSAQRDLEARGHEVELAGIFYHLAENDMSFAPYRRKSIEQLAALIAASRKDLALPGLRWFVSQQPPTDTERVRSIDVTAQLAQLAAADPNLLHIRAFDLPGREEELVITTPGIVALGELLAKRYLESR